MSEIINMKKIGITGGIGVGKTYVSDILRKLDYPVAPAVLSIVLGPLAEKALRQSLILSDGSMGIFRKLPDTNKQHLCYEP